MSDGTEQKNTDGEAGATPQEKAKKVFRGALAWMTKNSVAANILMIFLLVGGIFKACEIKKEVFPEFEIDQVIINVAYPGASPEEVEQGVILAIEENVRGIDGVKKITSTASENFGVVSIQLLLGTDPDQALNDIKAGVDRITSFPEDIERPVIFMPSFRNQVLSLAVYGEEDPIALKAVAERVRIGLLQSPEITVVEISGLPALEISIEVPQEQLRRYGLTIDEIAAIVRQASVELPGGVVKTSGGEILLRTAERRDSGEEFENIIIRSLPDGSSLRLGDIATIKDGFAETDQVATFMGQRAVMINVFRVGKQTPLSVSAAVHDYIDDNKDILPPGIEFGIWLDMSEFYEGRMNLLYRNAALGLVLVLLVLGLFLEIRLAFWVTMGIPISFVGSLVFLGTTDVSINMLSLFAFIVVLGMVVDDAIVVGEVVYRRREEGADFLEAAITGVREVAAPVTFAILTTIMAYMPMLFIPGLMGKFFRVIPIVVIAVLLMSLIESLLILPAHLAHSHRTDTRGVFGFINRQQQKVANFLTRNIRRYYIPVVRACVRRRYLTMCAAFAILIGSVGLVAGGRVESEFFPTIEGDVIIAEAQLPYGTSIERTRAVQKHLLSTANQIVAQNGGSEMLRGLYANIGAAGLTRNDPGRPAAPGSHLTEAALYLVPIDDRDITTEEFVRQWREAIGDVPGVERIKFSFGTGPSSGPPVNIELRHPDVAKLSLVSKTLATKIQEYAGTYDINDGLEEGKEQLDLTLRPEARALGLNELALARQIRSAFFGAEAVRQQRGRDELRVYVRLPRDERESEYNLEEFIVRTPLGTEVPLHQAARIHRGYSYTTIKRVDGKRTVSVTAEVDPAVNSGENVMKEVTDKVLPELKRLTPDVEFAVGGDVMEQRESSEALQSGMMLAVLAMFALLAIAFRSYSQPIIVLLAIPFGMVGAVFGHLLMGFKLSMMSMMGIVALAGVVVNDSLILIDAVNRLRKDGMPLSVAVVEGAAMRFRPILLTSLTTFFGLAPMILETSVQARFLIPMALSLGFGVMFATFITLLLIPAAYMILFDFTHEWTAMKRWFRRKPIMPAPLGKVGEQPEQTGGSSEAPPEPLDPPG